MKDYNFKTLNALNIPSTKMRFQGFVVKGFQRGRKMGILTANIDPNLLDKAQLGLFENGVYAGWAKVGNGTVHKAMISIGYNPFFKNESKSLETHILNDYGRDFYGEKLTVLIVGYIRKMMDFSSLDELIRFIRKDIELGRKSLSQNVFESLKKQIED